MAKLFNKIKTTLSKRSLFKGLKAEDDEVYLNKEDIILEGKKQLEYWAKTQGDKYIPGAQELKTAEEVLDHFKCFHENSFLETELKNIYWEAFLRFITKKLETISFDEIKNTKTEYALSVLRFVTKPDSKDQPFHHRSKTCPEILTMTKIQEQKKALIENYFEDFAKKEYSKIFYLSVTWCKLRESIFVI